MIRLLLPLAVLAFTVYALVDCVQTDEYRVRGLPKLVWVLLILIFTPVGGLAWFFAGREAARRLPGVEQVRGRFGPSGRPRGPLGPDDDPDFLKGL